MDNNEHSLATTLKSTLGNRMLALESNQSEVMLSLGSWEWPEAACMLRDHPALSFTQCINICGHDASVHKGDWCGRRFSATYYLRSELCTQDLCVQVYAEDDYFPEIESANWVWPSAGKHEQNISNRFGIEFQGQQSLGGRRMKPEEVQSENNSRMIMG